jgi:hypothetical protein
MERPAYHRCMRGSFAVALAVALWGWGPGASAQRGGGHGGGVAHGSAGGRGFSAGPGISGGAAPGLRGYAVRPGYAVARPAYAAPGYTRPGVRVAARPGLYGNRTGVRAVGRGYYPGYGLAGYGLGYPYGPGWVYPWLDGYDNSAFYDGSGDLSADASGQAADVYPVGVMPPPPQEQAQAAPMPVHPPLLAPEDAVTLIFKDGRPPLKIHNYVLTRKTLYVTDGRHRDIPVADIDLAATQKVNADAGVDFEMPK